jgi:class 3 adenylate cyclase
MSSVTERKLDELAASACSRAAVDAIRSLVLEGSDLDCYKVNAFRLARRIGDSRREVLRALLFATRLGIFDLNYDVYCPSCRGLPQFHLHLMGVTSRAHCGLCAIDWNVDFEEQIEVTFTVNPDLRKISIAHFSDRDFQGQVQYFEEVVRGRDERRPVFNDFFEPGTTKALEGVLEACPHLVYVPSHLEQGAEVEVTGPPARETQTIAITAQADGSVTPRAIAVAPGPVRFVVRYDYPRPWPLIGRKKGPPRNWTSAAYVISQQDFRDLFSGEFLSPEASFAIRSVTLLFTDIKGSTELYERIGDAKAYAVVHRHFRIMSAIIAAHEGGIVKTIGDAVMASFPSNVDGVKAAVAILRAFRAEAAENPGVELKVGLHRGPAIAVTSNRALDYFGRTVNIAARVQGKSEASEVLATESVVAEPKAAAFLAGETLTRSQRHAELKGIGDAFCLHSVRLAG